MPDSNSEPTIVDGKKEGYWVTHYANGNVRSQGAFNDGKIEGKWTLFHQNGNKQSEATFRGGKYTDFYVSFHENGHKFREGWYGQTSGKSYDGRKEGVWYQYETDGQTISTRVTYKRGRVIERLNYPDQSE